MTVPTPTYTSGDWGYDTFIENGTTYARVVSYSGTGGSGVTITIPDTLGGYVVKEVGKGGSYETLWDTTISVGTILAPLPSTVTKINNYAFYNGVKFSIDVGKILPPNLTYIGDYAFGNGQTYIGELTIPDSVTTIGQYAFQNGFYSKIVIPANVTSIGQYAFSWCRNTRSVFFKGTSRPTTLGTGCFGLNTETPASNTKYFTIYSPNNWASSVLNSYKNSKTTFVFKTFSISTYEYITYNSNKIQVDSAIRDGNGNNIANTYQPKHTTLTITIATSDWVGYGCTKTATGVTPSNTVFVSPAPASIAVYGDCGVYCSAQTYDALTFECSTVPSSAITVNVVVMS